MKIHVFVFSRTNKVGVVTQKNLDLLSAAAALRGHSLEVIYDSECQMRFSGQPELLLKNHDLSAIEVLIVQANIPGRNIMYRSNVINQFELLGVPVMNKEAPVLRAKNKIKTLQILTREHVPVPKTYVVNHAEYIDDVISEVGPFPVILKAVSGSHGRGVSIIESKRGLKSIIEMFANEGDAEPLMVQEYVRESKGKDVRVFIVGKKIVGAMERIAQKRGEFRSNFHLGGRVRVASMSRKEKDVAFAAIKACGLDFAGVDILRTNSGPKVIEVNANPGLEGITLATGRDIAGTIIDYAVKKVKRRDNQKQA